MGCGSSKKADLVEKPPPDTSNAQTTTGAGAKLADSLPVETDPVKKDVCTSAEFSAVVPGTMPATAPAPETVPPKALVTEEPPKDAPPKDERPKDEPPQDGPPKEEPPKEEPLRVWSHIRDAVRLWGDRGGGICQPQPLFDAIAALVTIDAEAQRFCGIHQASVHMGSNAKVAHALVPFLEGEVQDRLSKPGTLSISARTPHDELRLKSRLEEFLLGNVIITDPELVKAIHVQDVDWADVDNGAAVLSMAFSLKQSGAKHPLHAFLSERRFTSEFAPTMIHKDEEGNPIKTEVMTDAAGNPIQGLQFRVTTGADLSKYEVKPSIVPYIKEMEYEHCVHNEQDMSDLGLFECQILQNQLRRAGLGTTIVGRSGVFEKSGLSGNVHKLTWYMYQHDGSIRETDVYRKDVDEYFMSGVGNCANRRKLFQEYTKPLREISKPKDMQVFFEYCRKHPEDKIVVHCGGPLFLVQALAREPDLRDRVILIGAMFLSYDGEANLLGKNFNEGVAEKLTEEVFGKDGKKIHTSFPNAQVVCITTETCKSPVLTFVPFQDTLGEDPTRTSSLRPEIPLPNKGLNQPLLVISDDGKDPDDELAKILLSSLTRRGLAKSLGFISNLSPAKDRARLARGTLDQLGLGEIPVGVGEDMISGNSTTGSYEFDAPYMADLKNCKSNGVELFVQILNDLEAGVRVTLVCLSGLADAWLLLRDHRELFKKKVGRVVIMGGVEVEGENVKLDSEGYMIPDKAQNNTFDFESAQHFYRNVQKESIPLTVVTRWAAYAAKLNFNLYDKMAKSNHPVGNRLHQSQRKSLEHLWLRVQLPAEDPKREGLPGRCDKAWFCKVFLGGMGEDRDRSSSIWDLASTFQAYDPVALLASLHGVRARFMRPLVVDVQGTHGKAEHEILGISEQNSGVVEGVLLADWLEGAIVAGLESHDA